MPDEDVQGAPAASPQPDASAASSAEPVLQGPPQEPSTESGTPQAPTTSEPKFNMPPPERWEELRRQREAAEQRAVQAEQMARMALERVQAPPAAPVEDPWAGLVNHPDPGTAQFYQWQQRLFQHEARRVAEQQQQGVLQAVDAGRRELAAMKVEHFRREYPDIRPGSPEEAQIAGYVSQGYDLDVARKLTMHDRLEAENRALKAKQASVGMKVAANASGPTAGIPASAGLPGTPGDWREHVRQAFRKGGGLAEVVNAAGASRVESV